MAVAALGSAVLDEPVRRQVVELLRGDPVPAVRAAAAEALGAAGDPQAAEVLIGAGDGTDDPAVLEAVATALGELEASVAVPWLVRLASSPGETLVREAAVAALGAIGHPDGLATLLELVTDGPPQVRRRCVVALTVFDGDEVEAALHAALDDRNPMVREAAEMVVGRRADHPAPAPSLVEPGSPPPPGWTPIELTPLEK